MKTKTWKTWFVVAAVLSISTVIDCGGSSSPPPPPATGFNAVGQNLFLASDGTFQFLSFTTVAGNWVSDNGSAQGNTRNFQFFAQGLSPVNDGRVPATWDIFTQGSPCITTNVIRRNVTAGSNQMAQCVVTTTFLTADPSSIDLVSPPPAVSISGGGFNLTYGMPVVEYYDQYSGVLVASTTAYWVAADGSSLYAYTPDLSQVYSGAYNIIVSNVMADGSHSRVGVAAFSACCREGTYGDPPPPPPCFEGGVCEMY